MSAYADLEVPTGQRPGALAEGALERLGDLREKGRELADVSARRAGELARVAGEHVRNKPVTTGLIAAAIGVGLVFLFSSRARAGVMAAGETLKDRVGRAH